MTDNGKGREEGTTPTIEDAAWRVLAALEHKRNALNGQGHPGEDHDKWLHIEPGHSLPGVAHVYDGPVR